MLVAEVCPSVVGHYNAILLFRFESNDKSTQSKKKNNNYSEQNSLVYLFIIDLLVISVSF